MPEGSLMPSDAAPADHRQSERFDVPTSFEMGLEDGGVMQQVHIGKLLEGRLLVQGVSGAGKSWTLRRLLEQCARILPQIIIDPEGEFGSLAEEFGYLHVAAEKLDEAGLSTLAERIRQHRASVVLDLSEVGQEQQMISFIAFINALINVPREHWHPVLVVVDEAQLFAPLGGHSEGSPEIRKASVTAMADVMGRGRKRGLVGVLATQRLARLSKSVVSEITNFLIGLNTQDLDIKRAATNLGWDNKRAAQDLRALTSGRFVAAGPAFGPRSTVITVGPVKSRHLGATPRLEAPCTLSPEELRELVGLDSLIAAAAADGHLGAASGTFQARLATFLKHPRAALASQVYAMLAESCGGGELIGPIQRSLGVEKDEMAAAADLLEKQGLVESTGNGRRRYLTCVDLVMADDAGDDGVVIDTPKQLATARGARLPEEPVPAPDAATPPAVPQQQAVPDPWDDAEDARLRACYEDGVKDNELPTWFPGRSLAAIKNHASTLKIYRRGPRTVAPPRGMTGERFEVRRRKQTDNVQAEAADIDKIIAWLAGEQEIQVSMVGDKYKVNGRIRTTEEELVRTANFHRRARKLPLFALAGHGDGEAHRVV